MAPSRVKAVIFDLDNTLVDFMHMKRTSVDAALRAMIDAGLRMSHAEASRLLYSLYDQYGIEYSHIFQRFLEKANRQIDYRILASGIIAYRKAQAAGLQPYPQVVPTLLRLREMGLKLAILSDAPRLKVWLRLVEMRLESFFDTVVTVDDTGKRKPHKDGFNLVLRNLGVLADECIMIGDWPDRDIKGAKALGMTTVFAKYGAPVAQKVSVRADYTITSIGKLPGIVL